MEDFTPTTEDVRLIWIISQTGRVRPLAERGQGGSMGGGRLLGIRRCARRPRDDAQPLHHSLLRCNPGGALTRSREAYTLDTRNNTLGGDAMMFDLCEGDTIHLVDRWGHPYTGKVRYELSSRGYGTNLLVGPYLVRSYRCHQGAQVREIVSVTPHR